MYQQPCLLTPSLHLRYTLLRRNTRLRRVHPPSRQVLLGRKKYGTGVCQQGPPPMRRVGGSCTRNVCRQQQQQQQQHKLHPPPVPSSPGIGSAGGGSGLGYCRTYAFSLGDLTTCGDVIANAICGRDGPVPWADLRYLLGEVFYGRQSSGEGELEGRWQAGRRQRQCLGCASLPPRAVQTGCRYQFQ